MAKRQQPGSQSDARRSYSKPTLSIKKQPSGSTLQSPMAVFFTIITAQRFAL
jgi:hypothetical protein